MDAKQKKVIIIGATSGIGEALALRYIQNNCLVGVTGRREERLMAFKKQFPDNVHTQTMDVCREDAPGLLEELVNEMGGMDLLIYCAGIGQQNSELLPELELRTVYTNVVGFTAIANYVYNYFKREQREGQFAAISSVAGIRSLRHAPSYSATKRYITHYMACLAQKGHKDKLPVKFTTILPGFIRTELLRHDYPFIISLEKGADLIFEAIEKRKRKSTLPGRWRVIAVIWQLIPQWIWERV